MTDLAQELSNLRTRMELVLAAARADVEAKERDLAAARSVLVDAEMAFRRGTRGAEEATRPRHLQARERRGPLRRPLDGLQVVPVRESAEE